MPLNTWEVILHGSSCIPTIDLLGYEPVSSAIHHQGTDGSQLICNGTGRAIFILLAPLSKK